MKQVNEATDSSDRAAAPSQKKRAVSGGRVGSESLAMNECSFFLSSTKLSQVVQDIAFDALAPDCSIQVLPIFSEVLSAVFMCIQLPGNRVFNQSHCLSKVCVPAKEELFFVGFLPSASQTHRGCAQSFAV